MPFKVVQTIEKGKLRLTTVPDKWEQNGVLFWPKNKQDKLRRREECAPERTWATINCLVKRSNLRTFEDGEAEIDAMSDKSETETDSELPQMKRPSRTHKNILPSTSGKSFNEMAEEQVEKICEPSATAQEVLQQVTQEENDIQNINIDQPYVILNEEPQIQQLQDEIKSMKQDLKTIMENQGILCEIQNNLLIKISEFQTQFEGYIKITSAKPKHPDTTMKLIKTINDLEDFERKMTDVTIRAELFQKYHTVCNKRPGKGMSNAYYLVDEMFDRSFFNICSWTGSSKGDTPKVCFKSFSKTIQFFFDIVNNSDPSFTKANCDKFFKIIMKNSRSRCESNQRMSSSKQRLPRSKKLKNNPCTSSQSPIPQPSESGQRVEFDLQTSPPIQSLAANVTMAAPHLQSYEAQVAIASQPLQYLQPLGAQVVSAPQSTQSQPLQPLGAQVVSTSQSTQSQSLQPLGAQVVSAPQSTQSQSLQPLGAQVVSTSQSTQSQSLPPLEAQVVSAPQSTQSHSLQPFETQVVSAPQSTQAQFFQPLGTQYVSAPQSTQSQFFQLLGTQVVSAPRSTQSQSLQPLGAQVVSAPQSTQSHSLQPFETQVVSAPQSTQAQFFQPLGTQVVSAPQSTQSQVFQPLGTQVVSAPRSTQSQSLQPLGAQVVSAPQSSQS